MWWQISLAAIVALLAMATAALRWSRRRMAHRVRDEVVGMTRALAPADGEGIALDAFPDLPAPVRRYLDRAGVDGRERIRFARLRHGGTFSTDGGESWRPATGEEYFSTDPPGLLWSGDVRIVPGVPVLARDRYHRGVGEMRITVGGLVTLNEVRGPEMDAASLLRYVSELPLVPTALVPDERLSWEPLDSLTARVRIRDGDIEATGVYRFGPDGLPEGFAARRHRTEGDEQVEREWEGWYRNYREIEGLWIPGSFGVAWIVGGREEPYARFELETAELGVTEPW